MGLYTLPGPWEGFLCVILVNTALMVSIVKSIFRSILLVFGFRGYSSSSEQPSSEISQNPTDSFECDVFQSDAYIEEFKSRTPSIRFDSDSSGKRSDNDCTVCLTKFEPESKINRLSCGHVFHTVCLEQWLDYWNITCPLCRTPLMTQEDSTWFCEH